MPFTPSLSCIPYYPPDPFRCLPFILLPFSPAACAIRLLPPNRFLGMAKICKTNINLNLEIYEKTHTHMHKLASEQLKKTRKVIKKIVVIPIQLTPKQQQKAKTEKKAKKWNENWTQKLLNAKYHQNTANGVTI